MLSHFQRRIVRQCTAVAGLLIAICLWRGVHPLHPISLRPAAVEFQGTRAMESTRVIAEEYPDRVTGTPAAHRAADYLGAEFQKLGYQVASPSFSLWLGGQRVQGENVIAWREGASPESVAVIAHYDGQRTSHQAAEDNASGVGVLLELARVLRDVPTARGLIFAATDAEEWGMIGARELAGFLRERRTVAVISIDYLPAGPATAIGMSCVGQFRGYSPLWLRQWMLASGRAQNVPFQQSTGAAEWIERAVEISPQDQGPLLRAGIPAVNLELDSPDDAAVRARYHTTADIFRNFEPAAFQMMGSTVEQAVRSLATVSAPVPGGSAGELQVNARSYLPGAMVAAVQVLLFLPVLVAVFFAAVDFTKGDCGRRGWRLLEPVGWIIPPGLAVLLLYGFTHVNALPRYELYPATTKDPFLYHLPWAILATLAVVMAAGWIALGRLHALLAAPPPLPFAGKKRILFVWVAVVAVAGFADNPYAACLFLGGLAYAALLLLPPRGAGQRVANAALLIAAAAPFAALVYSFGHEIYLGWRIAWYLVLQAAYGVWSPVAVALFLTAAALWVQLLRVSVFARQESAGREGKDLI
jgi:hypothetical protein